MTMTEEQAWKFVFVMITPVLLVLMMILKIQDKIENLVVNKRL